VAEVDEAVMGQHHHLAVAVAVFFIPLPHFYLLGLGLFL
jgi:hypothetical protein